MKSPFPRIGLTALGIAAAFVGATLLLSLLPFAQPEKPLGPSHLYVNHALGFTLEVPDGFVTRDESNGVVISPKATSEVPNPMPVMQVRVRPTGEGGDVPTGSKVYKHDGKAYVVSLWRGAPWPFFDETAQSLRFDK